MSPEPEGAGTAVCAPDDPMARSLRLRGLLSGVGFDSCVFRLAVARAIGGWIQHDDEGALLHIEGPAAHLDAFIADLRIEPPVASRIAAIELAPTAPLRVRTFRIRPRDGRDEPASHTRH